MIVVSEYDNCIHIVTLHQLPQALMTDETIGNVPILILGNKIDRQEAISEEKLREIFGLYGQTTGKVSTHSSLSVFYCCFSSGMLF